MFTVFLNNVIYLICIYIFNLNKYYIHFMYFKFLNILIIVNNISSYQGSKTSITDFYIYFYINKFMKCL